MFENLLKNLNINIKSDELKVNINENGLNVKVLSEKGKTREKRLKQVGNGTNSRQGKATGRKKVVNKGENKNG
jgi:hypothetical protein